MMSINIYCFMLSNGRVIYITSVTKLFRTGGIAFLVQFEETLDPIPTYEAKGNSGR
jgi:hypothetical protein